MPMPKTKPLSSTLFLSLLFLLTHLSICNLLPVSGTNSSKTSELDGIMRRVCGGNMGQCLNPEMDSDINRRVLVVQKRYISYETLKKDIVPCLKPGASYYNCRAAGEANPYHRGCEAITGCARDIRDIKT